ncbi:hypothetical protein CDEST_02758 [Colletotrichum destructivum]|uniref:Uncharacterized protein n=1 Tax=Colletotrichum destructivum TaxID=34406 RepID=A0AAX4I3A1_9PEZI|nr:hypothetical protein CDEST_02758 [Colletotrichum destructivum]
MTMDSSWAAAAPKQRTEAAAWQCGASAVTKREASASLMRIVQGWRRGFLLLAASRSAPNGNSVQGFPSSSAGLLCLSHFSVGQCSKDRNRKKRSRSHGIATPKLIPQPRSTTKSEPSRPQNRELFSV